MNVNPASVGPDSTRLVCPSCQSTIMTKVNRNPSTKTHLIALVLCLICCPCMCIPYCVDSCQDADHFCPNCNCYIGKYQS